MKSKPVTLKDLCEPQTVRNPQTGELTIDPATIPSDPETETTTAPADKPVDGKDS